MKILDVILMRRAQRTLMIMLLFVMLFVMLFAPLVGTAATTNPSPGSPGYIMLPIQISGQYSATTTSVARFKLPWPCRVLYAGATARASGGTSPTLTVDVLEAGTSILSSAMSVTAGTITDGTISDYSLADESSITVNLTIGGTSPTWNDITVFLALKRL